MRHSLKQRFIAFVLLMAYTITGTSALPAVLTCIASIDGSHAVFVTQSPQGTRLMLHHRDHEYTPAVADHEKTLARVLVCLCNAAESGDHQFNSAQCDSNTGTERGASSRVVKHAPPVNLAATFQLARITLHPARDTTRTGGFPEGLLPRQGIRRALASVRLLI